MTDYTWRRAFILTIPIMLGYIPLAIAYAVMWTQNGLPALWALVASTFLYAGAMQFLLAGLLATGTSLGAVALATLAVNLRLIFYGFSFPTAAVLVSALITFALRAFPFLLARIARRYDTTFAWLGRVMPPGVMTILALYAASTLKWQPASAAAVSALALIAVIALEHRWRNPVISVLGGMSLYIAGQSLLALP